MELRALHRGQHTGKWEVEIHGFDHYNPIDGKIIDDRGIESLKIVEVG